MMLIRELEQQARDLSVSTPPKILGSVHLCAGQEAVPVGALAALSPTDQVVATYRGHGWAVASGLSLAEIFGEICHRQVGVNGGRGGSAYMMAPHARFIGENSIVGAGLPIACGIAMANVAKANGNIVIVSLGDGAFNQGATHEGMAFAAARSLPIVIVCENNGWSEMTPTSLTFKTQRIASRASAYGMPGVTVDGTDPVTIRETVLQAATRARQGEGPVLIECRVPRLWGHYNRDIEHYRPKEDKDQAATRDPITLFSEKLIRDGEITSREFEALGLEVREELSRVAVSALESAEPAPETAKDHVWAPTSKPEPPTAGSSDVKKMSYIQAVNAALDAELSSRSELLVYGEDVGVAGGIFGASRGLQKKYGPGRVFDTPISESAILGSAVGASIMGMKPVVEIMWADFSLVALDQLINQAANVRYITRGRSAAPIVVRTQQGVTPGSCAQHSQSLEALLAHIPGLRVAVAATPQDAYSILRAAVACDDPCVIFEARSLYQNSGNVDLNSSAEPIGKARLYGSGRDAVIITWGTMLGPSLEAADSLKQDNIDVAVLDLRWLSPLDEEALFKAVENAGYRAVVAHEANITCGFGAEVVARLHEAFAGVPLQIARVGAPNVRIPASPVLMRALIPNASQIANTVHRVAEKPVAKRVG
ncbi:MAG: alpha-ketoacid dehydrogenase subunit alpha/beta [Candidatus Acidiferrales bacterium]